MRLPAVLFLIALAMTHTDPASHGRWLSELRDHSVLGYAPFLTMLWGAWVLIGRALSFRHFVSAAFLGAIALLLGAAAVTPTNGSAVHNFCGVAPFIVAWAFAVGVAAHHTGSLGMTLLVGAVPLLLLGAGSGPFVQKALATTFVIAAVYLHDAVLPAMMPTIGYVPPPRRGNGSIARSAVRAQAKGQRAAHQPGCAFVIPARAGRDR